MSDRPYDYGLLINQDIKLHRMWFKQMLALHGINCIYKAPLKDKQYNERGDLITNYAEGIKTSCIFQDHPDQKSLKKMGWVAELQENSSIIHVPYDLPDIQVGALFEIPSGIDDAAPRVFRVISMQNIMIYPASITCEIAPEYETSNESHVYEQDLEKDTMPLLMDLEGDD